jgi:cell wall-associated NlpC family hydrolase
MDEQFAFNGETKSVSQKRDGEFVKSIAMKYLNAPELAGGKSPFGISPQGLVSMVFKITGFALPWTILQLSQAGKKVKEIASAKTGDLAFFKDKKGAISHVGIIVGEGKLIHVFGQVRVDHINDEGILPAETKIYTHSLAFVRRIIG